MLLACDPTVNADDEQLKIAAAPSWVMVIVFDATPAPATITVAVLGVIAGFTPQVRVTVELPEPL